MFLLRRVFLTAFFLFSSSSSSGSSGYICKISINEGNMWTDLVIEKNLPCCITFVEKIQILKHGWIIEHVVHDFMAEKTAELKRWIFANRIVIIIIMCQTWAIRWNVNSWVGSISPLLAFLSASSLFFLRSSEFCPAFPFLLDTVLTCSTSVFFAILFRRNLRQNRFAPVMPKRLILGWKKNHYELSNYS